MSPLGGAIRALQFAREAGLKLGVKGDRLTLEAEDAPPPAVLDLLKRHKEGVLALLRAEARPLASDADVAALKLQFEWGADEALSEQPLDRRRGGGGLSRAEASVPASPPERMWAAELAVLMAFTPGQRITDPARAAQYFAGEAHRVLDQARHEPNGAERLMAKYRRRGVGGLSANSTPPARPWEGN